MLDCQIMTYGGKHHWIDVAHRKTPNTKWFIFVGAPYKGQEPDYWEDINEKIKNLEAQQNDYPKSEKIRYSYLEINFENNVVELIRYFNALIQFFSLQTPLKITSTFSPIRQQLVPSITCNITSGIFEMRIALFIASQLHPNLIKEIFYFNKQTFEKNVLLRNLQLPRHGKKVLKIIGKVLEKKDEKSEPVIRPSEFSLSELQSICKESKLKMDLPSLSRLVKKLRAKGYLNERREGRMKYLSITDLGWIYYPNRQYFKDITEKLRLK